ncbi:MAG: hypothetical protein M3277_12435 [Actinomycetota bacterium]|nr:hypothetical protein [Actinomycetota bacterium]
MTSFSLIGVRDGEKVGALISFGDWDHATEIHKLVVSSHATPGLRGVVIVQNMLTPPRVGSSLPQVSVDDIERQAERNLGGNVKVRIASWRQGDPIDDIRRAVREVLS